MDDETFQHDDSLNERKVPDVGITDEEKKSDSESLETQDSNIEQKNEQIDESAVTNTASQSEEKREKVSLENVKLDLRFEMNRIKTSLSELRNYEAGYVFDFTLNSDEIYLTVAGQTIGVGQLVEIGQNVGVRITEIYK